MTQSAEYFLAGFFGLQWPNNATLELVIDKLGFNNSLAGYYACTNSLTSRSHAGNRATAHWIEVYLSDAVHRLNKLITFHNSSISLSLRDVYSMQSLCAYETVALGYSSFCPLYTYQEWEGYEYSIDISFAGNHAFQVRQFAH